MFEGRLGHTVHVLLGCACVCVCVLWGLDTQYFIMRVYILQSTGNKWLISIIFHWKLGFYTQACFLSSVRQVIGRQQVDI